MSCHNMSCHNMLQHLIWWGPSTVYKLYWGEVDHCSKMDSYSVGNLFWLVFRDELGCIFCYTHCANNQEKLIHIFHKHKKIWNIASSKFSSIVKKLWSVCFIHSDNDYTCLHCKDKFHTENVKILHNHMILSHPIVMLGYTILYNDLC